MINLIQGNCKDLMKDKPDNYYDLAIVDPPYGINEGNAKRGDCYVNLNGKGSKRIKVSSSNYKKSNWDKNKPDESYFLLLQLKSKNQIIWGGNYFTSYLMPSSGWVFWDKVNGESDFSDGELAYTSFNRGLRMVKYKWNGMLQADMKNKEKRIHPTQKPIALYKWLLKNYAKPGDKILDTHGGSFSHAIAVHEMNEFHQMNLSLDIIEIDKDYFEAGKKRYEQHIKQLTIFSK